MNKAQVIERVRQTRNLDIETANRAVNVMLEEISFGLASGSRVEIRGFGVFTPTERRPRIGRNPRTGEKVSVDGKTALAFRASRLMIERLNPDPE